MDSGTEGYVRVWPASDVKIVRVLEDRGVSVGRRGDKSGAVPFSEQLSAKFHILEGDFYLELFIL